jgi:hypothetical protein
MWQLIATAALEPLYTLGIDLSLPHGITHVNGRTAEQTLLLALLASKQQRLLPTTSGLPTSFLIQLLTGASLVIACHPPVACSVCV